VIEASFDRQKFAPMFGPCLHIFVFGKFFCSFAFCFWEYCLECSWSLVSFSFRRRVEHLQHGELLQRVFIQVAWLRHQVLDVLVKHPSGSSIGDARDASRDGFGGLLRHSSIRSSRLVRVGAEVVGLVAVSFADQSVEHLTAVVLGDGGHVGWKAFVQQRSTRGVSGVVVGGGGFLVVGSFSGGRVFRWSRGVHDGLIFLFFL
jgi:hypothetical protein